jgi:long-chain acyl-CoA synthetase
MGGVTYSDRPWLKIYEQIGLPYQFDYPKIPLFEIIDRAAAEYPDSKSMVYFEREFTYAELKSYVDRLATALSQKMGIRKGDVVGVQLFNSPQFLIGVYGSLKAGATVALMSPLLPTQELEYELNASGAKVLLTDDSRTVEVRAMKSRTKLEHLIVTSVKDFSPMEEPLPEIPGVLQLRKVLSETGADPPKVEINPVEDVALLFFTGGTTGIPKGVMLTHYNLTTNILQTFGPTAAGMLEPNKGNFSVMGCLPFFHIYGFTCAMNVTLYWAGCLLLVPDARDTKMIYELLVKYRPLLMPGVPTQFMRLLREKGVNLSELKGCVPYSGSAALPPEVSKEYEQKAGVLVSEGYGLSETSPVTHSNFVAIFKGAGLDLGLPIKVGSIGIPVPDTDVKIVDIETGTKEMPVGEPGEMIIKGPQVMKGYWPTPGNGLRDGWLYTGDVAKMDEDGYFYIVDRTKDMINVSGLKVYGRVVDDILYEHPAVAKAAAVGIPDPERPGSERVKAFIELREGYKPTEELKEDILRHCRNKLPPYAVPRFVEFRKELPLTVTEKIFKRKLREEEIEKMKKAGLLK